MPMTIKSFMNCIFRIGLDVHTVSVRKHFSLFEIQKSLIRTATSQEYKTHAQARFTELIRRTDNQSTEDFWLIIERSIRILVAEFEETPYFFYKEYDAQRFLYHLLISEQQFKRIYKTRDGKDTCLVHGEYPSSGNLPLDMVVLDPRGTEKR